jgi:hypothetical protein
LPVVFADQSAYPRNWRPEEQTITPDLTTPIPVSCFAFVRACLLQNSLENRSAFWHQGVTG